MIWSFGDQGQRGMKRSQGARGGADATSSGVTPAVGRHTGPGPGDHSQPCPCLPADVNRAPCTTSTATAAAAAGASSGPGRRPSATNASAASAPPAAASAAGRPPRIWTGSTTDSAATAAVCAAVAAPRSWPTATASARVGSAGADPIGYLFHALPAPLIREFGARFPNELVELIRRELRRRTPDQLRDRVERRWHARWSHTLQEKDEDGRRRKPLEIAEQLLRPGLCAESRCEDGRLVTDDTPCPRCANPLHRFVPAQADRRAASDRARTTAAAIRREMLDRRTRGRS